MSSYLGSYTHQIDEKGRLSLPAPYRRGNEERPFVLVKVHPNCLTLFPEEVWAEVSERLRGMLRREPGARAYALGIVSRAVEVTLDRQGRILVPPALREEAGIAGVAKVVGAIDRIELWDPAHFDEEVARPVPDVDRFTHEVFG